LSLIPPVLFNAVIIGLEIWYFSGRTAEIYFISALEIAAGQAVMCIAVGVPFMQAVKKTRVFDRLNSYTT